MKTSESSASTWKIGERKSSRKASPPLGPTMSETLEILKVWWWRWWWCLWYIMTVKILSETITSLKQYHDEWCVSLHAGLWKCFFFLQLLQFWSFEFWGQLLKDFLISIAMLGMGWDYPYIWIYMEWDMIKVKWPKINCFETSSVRPIAIFLFCFV